MYRKQPLILIGNGFAEYFIRPILYLILVFMLFFLGYLLIKMLQKRTAKNSAACLTKEITDYLRMEEHRRKMDVSDWGKMRKNTNKKLASYAIILFCCFVVFGVKEGFSTTYFLAVVSCIVVLAIAFSILLLHDKRRLSSSHDQGHWIVQAYVLQVHYAKGYSLVVAYFDFCDYQIHTIPIQFDSEDLPSTPVQGDYIPIILAVKGSRLKYCCVAKG